MQILVDADACPVVAIVERIARDYHIPLLVFCDTSHIMDMEYGTTITVSKGADAVDFALLKETKTGDLVVTQDYGVAAMALGRGAFAIHQSGKWYTDENIDVLLYERHLAKKSRSKGKRGRLKGPKKRTCEDDLRFEESLLRLIKKAMYNE